MRLYRRGVKDFSEDWAKKRWFGVIMQKDKDDDVHRICWKSIAGNGTQKDSESQSLKYHF